MNRSVIVAAAALSAASVRAAVVPWNNPAGGNFQDGANWVGGVAPGSSDVALFDLSSNGYTVTVGGNPTLSGILVEDDGLSELTPVVFAPFGMMTTSGDFVVGSGTGNSAFVSVPFGQSFAGNVVVGTNQGQGYLQTGNEFTTTGNVSVGSTNVSALGASQLVVSGPSSSFFKSGGGATTVGSGTGGWGIVSVLDGGYAEFSGNFQAGDNNGSGVVNVREGANLINTGFFVSIASSGGVGGATVAGMGSLWDVQGLLAIGTFADSFGQLTVESGGTVTTDFLNIGSSGVGNGSIGEVFVRDPGSSIQCLNTTVVTGATSESVLLMSNGADAVTDELQIGSTPGGQSGSVATLSSGSTLTVNGNAHVGWMGSGSLAALVGGAISVGGVVNIGNDGVGNVFLNGESQLDCGDLRVGWDARGHGVLTILGGSTVSAGYTIVGGSADTTGYIHLEGQDSTLQIEPFSPLHIGEAGGGALEIFDGAVAVSNDAAIATQPGGSGWVEIAGAGSRWEVNGSLAIGSPSAHAQLGMRDGGTLMVTGGITIHGPYFPDFPVTFAGLYGYGNVQASVTNSGFVYPGNSLDPGTFFITGNFTQTADGFLHVQLSDSIPALDIGGTASLNGVLQVTGPDAFTVPAPGSLYPLLSANSLNGGFASVVQPYGNDGLLYEVVPGKGPSLDILVSADCNSNGQADVKDIDQQISEDVDENQIPDECVDPGNGCGNNRWYCAANWPLGDIPGEFSADFHVTMGTGDNICLDENATIQSLIMRNGSFLDMSDAGGGTCDGNLILDAVAGMTIDDSTLAIGPSRMIDAGLAGTTNLWLRNGGRIEADGSTIHVGDVLIESGGVYRSSATVTSPPNTAVLHANNVILRSGFSSEPSELSLTGDMELIVQARMVIDGTGAPCECGAVAASRRADYTPPVLNADGRRWSAVDNIDLKGSIDINIRSALVLGGNFNNESVCPGCADFSGGSIELNGPGLRGVGARSGVFAQRFEAASPDVGAVAEIGDQPFGMGTLEVGAGVEATFDDRFDNDGAGLAPCSEAIYVDHLILGANSTTIARNVRLYYNTLTQDPTATLTLIGCGLAQEVACITANPVSPEASPQTKNRYVSFAPGNAGVQTAIRVKLVSLDRFHASDGQVRWVGAPTLRPQGGGAPFWAAPLQCTPHFQDWSGVTDLHVYGAEVVPLSTYDVQAVHEYCDAVLNLESSYSAPLTVQTAKWGDVIAPHGTGQPNFGDINALVEKFKALPTSIHKARAQLQPNIPNPQNPINFSDISADVEAFKGRPYPYAGPGICP